MPESIQSKRLAWRLYFHWDLLSSLQQSFEQSKSPAKRILTKQPSLCGASPNHQYVSQISTLKSGQELTTREAVIVGCLPPFKTIISSKSGLSSYNYGSSGFNPNSYPNSYNRNASTRPTRRSHAASWSEVALPLQDRSTCQNLDNEIYEQNVHITGGQGSGAMQSKNSQGRVEDYELKGDIKMVKEFVS
jgi:hypothetical protein